MYKKAELGIDKNHFENNADFIKPKPCFIFNTFEFVFEISK